MRKISALFFGLWIVSALCLFLHSQAQRGSAGYIPQLNAGREALREKRWSTAAEHFRIALEWDGKGTDAYIGLGYVYLATGRRPRAVAQFQIALRLRPHSSEAERGIR